MPGAGRGLGLIADPRERGHEPDAPAVFRYEEVARPEPGPGDARVIAVASGRHEAFLRDLGADEFIDYTKTAAETVAHDIDLVIDTVGGAEGHRFLRVVKRGGMLCPIFPGRYHQDRAAELGVTIQAALDSVARSSQKNDATPPPTFGK